MAKEELEATNSQNVETRGLTEAHREYLLHRHGTLDLEPVPDMSDGDPYNWPKSKKLLNLAMIAFHAMMATFTAAAVQSVFAEMAADLGVSIHRASYMLSLQIAILGSPPLFWRPLSQRFGRRPVFLLSLVCSLVGNVGCAVSPSYATMALCRAITAFFISPASAIGSDVVTETFFKKERARCMGIWTIMVTLGVPMAPFIFGFVAVRVGYRWIYWILAITNGVQFILYFLLGRKTLYLRGPTPSMSPPPSSSEPSRSLLSFRRLDPTPFRAWDFVKPLTFFRRRCVVIPTAAYAMNIAIIVGSLVGEQIGGFLSDWWMWRRYEKHLLQQGTNATTTTSSSTSSSHRNSETTAQDQDEDQGMNMNPKAPQPEFRLWLAYPGFLLTISGVVAYLVQIGAAGHTWNITPDISMGLAAGGNQIVTTVMTTYAVDCYRDDAASVGVFINFVRQIWGLSGPSGSPR
ncbi:major facilitator superfamily domain-containing protein [Chaetomium strumarium]|uniref:Major facilitator superfamily domain-containing protein n=1 Tax=Chaetomium strumarium TaxID=1170767 RepID=A0AAJ0GMN3_9PEZI|nr:major facilitator superfamily domain-containing protein [Chaetomium strumarium]